MYLTRLDIHGFKTFPARTKLAFPRGLTAIVGPNGSGKSNLADAIRWALGEQSMLALRGRKSEDVIFAGTPGRSPAGMTEVALTFANEDGAFPLELAEVSIARRAYRSGENEYLLNGNRVRLRDIQQLLAAAGIGHGMMIGQGLIDQVLAQRPEDRRILLEEAAGVRALYMQEHEADNKLLRVHDNMNRVRDILLELEPRLATLASQAQAAQRAEALQQELAQALHTWYAAQLAQLVTEEEAATRDAEGVTSALAALETRLAHNAAERQTLENTMREQEQALHRLDARAGGLRNRLHDLTQRQAVQQERQTHLRRSVAEAQGREADLAARQEAVTARLPEQEAALAATSTALTALQGEWHAVKGGIERREEAGRAAEEALQRLRQDGVAVTTRLSSLTAAIADVKRQREAVLTRAAEAAEQLQHVRRLQRDRTAERTKLQTHAEELQARAAAALAEKERAESEFAEAERALQELEVARQEPLRRRADLEGRVSALQALLAGTVADDERAPETVAAQAGVRMLPALSTVDVPARIATALAAALPGETMLAASMQDAGKLVIHVVGAAAAHATVLAADLLAGEQRAVPALPGVVGCAADLVTLPAASAALAPVLRAILVVEDVPALLAVAQAQPWPLLVTLDGVVYSGGVFRYAQAAAQRGQQQAQYRKLAAELEELRRRCEGFAEQETALRGRQEQARAAARQVAQTHARGAEAAQAAAAAVQRHTHEREELARQCAWWEQVAAETQARRAELEETIADREREAPLAVAAKERLTRELGERERAHADLRQELETQRAAVGSLQTQLAVQQQRKEHLTRAIAQLRAERQGFLGERTKIAALRAERQEALGALQADMATTAETVRQTADQRAAADAARTAQREQLERSRVQHGVLTRTRADLANQRSARAAERSRAEQVLAGVRQRREDTVVRWLSDEPEAEPVPEPAAESLEELQQRVTSLRRRVRRIGPVNPLAVEEFGLLEQRATFLREQIDDLEAATGDLDEVKRQLRRTVRRDFTATFRQVATDFRRMVRVLFDGGDAELSLTDPQDPARTGIEITVRLPGKRRQALSLLSGGERALVALALLFALLSARATPLCLLDEADAMLDETNIVRFCRLLREYGQETQFLIITHNRGTMEMADALFGVSMAEEGVSQVLSLRLEELREQVLSPVG